MIAFWNQWRSLGGYVLRPQRNV